MTDDEFMERARALQDHLMGHMEDGEPIIFFKIATDIIATVLRSAVQEAVEREREAILAICELWMRADHMQLHAGEMTEQEIRSVRAVVSAIKAAIRSRGQP